MVHWKATHFAQAVQKAKAAGMKKGDKFKVDAIKNLHSTRLQKTY